MLTRRTFVKACAASAIIAHAARISAQAQVSHGGLLVVVTLRGGWDGLHMLAPMNDPLCYQRDRALGIAPRPATLRVNAEQSRWDWRLHPAASALAPLFADGSLAAVPRFGPAHAPRSHLAARQHLARKLGTDQGWLSGSFSAQPFGTLAITPGHPPMDVYGMESCVLSAAPCTLVVSGSASVGDATRRAGEALIAHEHPAAEFARRVFSRNVNPPALSSLDRALAGVLAAVDEGLDVRAAIIEDAGWDTHELQEQRLSVKLQELSGSLARFWRSVQAAGRAPTTRVLVLSEFGRELTVNDRGGTEHGHAGLMLALGGSRSGVLGSWDALKPDQLLLSPDERLLVASPEWDGALTHAALIDGCLVTPFQQGSHTLSAEGL